MNIYTWDVRDRLRSTSGGSTALLSVANGPKGKSSPTVAVYNDTRDRIILVSVVGKPEDYAFFVIYGKQTKMV